MSRGGWILLRLPGGERYEKREMQKSVAEQFAQLNVPPPPAIPLPHRLPLLFLLRCRALRVRPASCLFLVSMCLQLSWDSVMTVLSLG